MSHQTSMPGRRLPSLLFLALAATWTASSRALDLVQAWDAAQAHAPAAAQARAARDAGTAQADQAKALWRPSVAVEGGIGYGSSESATRGARFSTPAFGQSTGVSFDTSVEGGTSTRYGLVLRQPIYDRERSARSEALAIAAGAADPEWAQARQALMLRTVDACFAVALAEERLRVLRRQEEAVDAAAAEARDRFRIGDRPVTDVHEAEARAAALQAERLLAESQRAQGIDLLADLTGAAVDPATLPVPGDADIDDVGPVQPWVDRAARGNPALRLAEARLRTAEAQDRASSGAFSPTLDVVAQFGRDRIAGDGSFGAASNTSRNRAFGLQLSVPLYTGGLRTARHAEAHALVEKARAEADDARQEVLRETRAAWRDLAAGRSRSVALAAALRASQARLDATRVGLEAGDRTTLDLLNAENDAASADMALLEARLHLLTRRLQLSALAGELDDSQLGRVNALLHPRAP